MDIDFLRKIKIEEPSIEAPSFTEVKKDNQGAVLTASDFPKNDIGFFKYARWLVYVLVFLVPLFFLPWTSEVLEFNKQFLIFVLATVGLILYFGQVIKSGRLPIKKSSANYAVLIFIGAVLIAFLFSDFRYQSLFGGFAAGFQESLISLVGFAILFFLILNVFGLDPVESRDSARKDISKLLNLFGISLFLVLFLGVLELFGLSIFKILGVAQDNFNTVGTLNGLGMISVVLLAFSFSKINLEKNLYFNYLKIPAAAMALFFLLILNWWVLWLAVISGMVFVLGLNYLSNSRRIDYIGPGAIVFSAVLFMLFNFNLTGVFGITLPLEVAPSFGASLRIAKGVLNINPLFGIGPENFSLAYDLYKPASINSTAFWNLKLVEATSEFFNSLISYGVIGFSAFVFLIFTGFKLGFKNKTLLPVFVVLAAIWVLYPFNMTLGFIFWLMLGLLALLASDEESRLNINLKESSRHSLAAVISFVGILTLTAVSFYFITSKYAANIKFARALIIQDLNQQNQLLTEAISLDQSESLYSRALASLLISKIDQEFKNLNNVKASGERQEIISKIQNFSSAVINLSNEISKRNPEDSLNWLSRALVYENLINLVEGSDEWAIKMYEEYARLSPKDPLPYLRMGNIYFAKVELLRQVISQNNGMNNENRATVLNQIAVNLKLAEENYNKAIELKPNYVLAIYNLGAIYEREGRVRDAINQLEITKTANSSDANIALQLGLLYYRDNQKDKSFNEFQRAVEFFSDFSNARWYLALLYEEKNQVNEALEELYKIREFNPDNQILKNKISELEKGVRSIPPQKITGVGPLEEQNQEQ